MRLCSGLPPPGPCSRLGDRDGLAELALPLLADPREFPLQLPNPTRTSGRRRRPRCRRCPVRPRPGFRHSRTAPHCVPHRTAGTPSTSSWDIPVLVNSDSSATFHQIGSRPRPSRFRRLPPPCCRPRHRAEVGRARLFGPRFPAALEHPTAVEQGFAVIADALRGVTGSTLCTAHRPSGLVYTHSSHAAVLPRARAERDPFPACLFDRSSSEIFALHERCRAPPAGSTATNSNVTLAANAASTAPKRASLVFPPDLPTARAV